MNTTAIQRIALTSGEPAGIGPDLCLHIAQQAFDYEIIVLGCAKTLKARANQLKLQINFELIHTDQLAARPRKKQQMGSLTVLDISCAETVTAGQLNVANAAYVIRLLDEAIEGCQHQLFDAMVTAPVQKSIIADSGLSFSGHTEYLAEKTQTEKVVMMLATQDLRVALVTTHLPLREVADAINEQSIMQTSRILVNDLQHYFGLKNPKVLVAGLNPHAGENGHLGREEIDIIEPTLEKLRLEGLQLLGPLPADTLFTEKYLATADAVLAMYHDQGLPVLKFHGFGQAANITLGLPIIRTSVDHGTALDLAGTAQAHPGSLLTALNIAEHMATKAQQAQSLEDTQ